MIDAVRFGAAAADDGAAHVATMHGRDREAAEHAGCDGHAVAQALEHGQQAAVAGAVDDGRPQGDHALAQGTAQYLFHHELGPAVGGHGRAGGVVAPAGGSVAGAAGGQTGDQHHALRGLALRVETLPGRGQGAGGLAVGAQIVLPAQTEEQGGHVDADVLAAQGFFQSGAAAQVGADNLHPGGQMVAAGRGAGDAGDAGPGSHQLGQQVTAHEAGAAGDDDFFAVQPGSGHAQGSIGAMAHDTISLRYRR